MMLKRETDAPEFDREKVKPGIMPIADPEKSEIMRRQQETEALTKKYNPQSYLREIQL